MTGGSMQDYTPAPTPEEVGAYIRENGFVGKVSPSKFYAYYAKQNFEFKGAPMDWKGKVTDWARNQRAPVPMTAADYKLLGESSAPAPAKQTEGQREYLMDNGRTTTNVLEYTRWVVSQI